ncbi:MAG: hypothetical protein ACTSYM_03650 [Candidatus Baldrarchaeia archaeon]
MITDTVWMLISYLLGLFDSLFSLFDGIRETVSRVLGVEVTVEAWFAFWLFIALAVSTYVLSSKRGAIEPVTISTEVSPESVITFKTEKIAVESALEFLQDAFRKGEISEQLYARLKSFYSDRLDSVNEKLANLSRVEEFRGIEVELEEAKREFLERLKAPKITEEAKVEEPVIEKPTVSREIVPKQISEPTSREVTSPRIEAPKVEVARKAKVEVKPAPPPPAPPKGETLVQVLRDEMLKELRRLKEIIEKSS